MMIRRSGVLAALSAVLFLAGCAGNAVDTGSAAGPAASAPSSAGAGSSGPAADPSASGDAFPVPDAGTTGSPKPQPVETLTGKVIAGVEPGCLVLTAPEGPHLLVITGDMTRTVKVGDTVSVTGRADPGMVTTCQQGTPFVVTAVK